ncbi:hypothetical protein GHT06_003786 [Daphnia sinensis]|uniref:Uncharacterized protein n=1 Tax=Daphnia sinensis TaxID=1820382 RepID=A0AAD5PNI2_9CRUS|nr:hypothetical protein GHT06_003786 [Daphnia sinensis]
MEQSLDERYALMYKRPPSPPKHGHKVAVGPSVIRASKAIRDPVFDKFREMLKDSAEENTHVLHSSISSNSASNRPTHTVLSPSFFEVPPHLQKQQPDSNLTPTTTDHVEDPFQQILSDAVREFAPALQRTLQNATSVIPVRTEVRKGDDIRPEKTARDKARRLSEPVSRPAPTWARTTAPVVTTEKRQLGAYEIVARPNEQTKTVRTVGPSLKPPLTDAIVSKVRDHLVSKTKTARPVGPSLEPPLTDDIVSKVRDHLVSNDPAAVWALIREIHLEMHTLTSPVAGMYPVYGDIRNGSQPTEFTVTICGDCAKLMDQAGAQDLVSSGEMVCALHGLSQWTPSDRVIQRILDGGDLDSAMKLAQVTNNVFDTKNAVHVGSIETAIFVIRHGANIRQVGVSEQGSVLHVLVSKAIANEEREKSCTHIIRFLMTNGLYKQRFDNAKLFGFTDRDLLAKNKAGKTPFGLALENDCYYITRWMVEFGARRKHEHMETRDYIDLPIGKMVFAVFDALAPKLHEGLAQKERNLSPFHLYHLTYLLFLCKRIQTKIENGLKRFKFDRAQHDAWERLADWARSVTEGRYYSRSEVVTPTVYPKSEEFGSLYNSLLSYAPKSSSTAPFHTWR